MTIPTGRTGVERGVDQFVSPSGYPFKVVSRNTEGGPMRSDAVSLDGTVIGQEFTAGQSRRLVRYRVEALQTSDIDDLRTLYDDTGPVTVKDDPDSATTYLGLLRGQPVVSYYDGAHPDNAPASVTWAVLEFEIIRLE